MGLLQKLKSALGFDETESTASTGPRGNGDVDVTVEREPSTESEDAVKGTETATTASAPETATADEEADESVAETATDETEPATEEAESDTVVEEEKADAVAEVDDSEPGEATEPEPDEGSTDPVTEIKGIGPAYAERLSSIGIETVGQLAAADAAEIAAETDLSESRVDGWIERATEY